MSTLLVVLLACVISFSSATCATKESDYTACIQPVTACLDRVRKDVVTQDSQICDCYFDNNYFRCLSWGACQAEAFVVDAKTDLETYNCLVSEPQVDAAGHWHPDWSGYYSYDFSMFWKGTFTADVKWHDLFTVWKTRGTIAAEPDTTKIKARSDIRLFCDSVASHLRDDCVIQRDRAQAHYDCNAIELHYAVVNFHDGDAEVDVWLYLNGSESMSFSLFALLSVVLCFMF